MTAKNDITGDTIITRSTNDAFRDNWDRIFGTPKIPKSYYQHGSMFGTYQVPCDILEELSDGYRIQFYDQWINETCERTVTKDTVTFE